MRGVTVTIPAGPASGTVDITELSAPGIVGARRIRGMIAANAGVYQLEAGNKILSASYVSSSQVHLDVPFSPDLGGVQLIYSLGSAPFTSFSFTLFVSE